MTLATYNSNYQRVGSGQLYLAAAPAADPGSGTLATTIDGYYGLFYDDAAKKQVIKTGVYPYCNLTADGLNQKVSPSIVEFDYNNAPKTKMLAGIDEASVEFAFYDVTASHLADIFGLAAGDTIAVAAAAAKAGRKIAAVGANVNYTSVVAMFRMQSVIVSGYYDHFLWPLCSMVPEIDVKLSKKDAFNVKLTLSLRPSPYMTNAAGNGIIMVADTVDAAATS